jgi:Holliday junction DNA helicase RuvA
MFYSLTGEVVYRNETMCAISCGGVAFACAATANTLRELRAGEKATLFTHLNVREDAMDLFGFATRAELHCFRQLIAVTGVGPKAALALLSAFTPEQLGYFVAAGDAKSLTRAQGVGPKLAQRLVLELKDKLKLQSAGGAPQAAFPGNAGTPADADALDALLALGYQQSDAVLALRGLEDGLDTQTKIRLALKLLAL